MSFNHELIQSILKKHFGFDNFRHGQSEAISCVLNGQDTLVVMPTGSGKSLCYQLPALLFDGITLVISPLIALMKDQVDILQNKKIKATSINSSLSKIELNKRQADIRSERYKLIYVSPERLRNDAFLNTLTDVDISLLAVDEAHCISQWGHDFRPDYLHIRELLAHTNRLRLMALTATATPVVQNDILQQLNMDRAKKIVTGFDRFNLEFRVEYAINEEKKLELLSRFIENRPDKKESGIIYVGTRRQAEFLNSFVSDVLKIPSCFYHAGLDNEERKRNQELFLSGQIPVIIATNAFGMGIDKRNVRFIVHYDFPSTLERYYQEAGRAGRDGKQAQALLIYCPDDRALQEWFIENDSPSEDELRLMFQVIVEQQGQGWTSISYDNLARLTGVHPAKLKVGIDQLEQASGLIRFPDSGSRLNLQITEQDASSLNLTELLKLNKQRRRRKLKELKEMISYAEGNRCRREALLSHFGDVKSEQEYIYCCDNCEIENLSSHSAGSVLGTQVAHQILQCVTELNQPLGREKIAQVLRGSEAKSITKYGHHQIPSYGVLKNFTIEKTRKMVDWLVENGYLKLVGAGYPVVQLSPKGKQALEEELPISLPLPPSKHDDLESNVNTVEKTYELFQQRLSPEQIAAKRGRVVSTIYGHLAELIERGDVSVDDVISADVRQQIEDAIAQTGTESLSPIKELLPDEISYDQIRCVVASAKLQDNSTTSLSPEKQISKKIYELYENLSGQNRMRFVSLMGDMRVKSAIKMLTKALQDENDNVRKLAASALQEIEKRDREAIHNLKSKQSEIETFLHTAHPQPLKGNWDRGFALDFHSRYQGHDNVKTELGQMVTDYKYHGHKKLVKPLTEKLVNFIREHSRYREVDLLLAIPSTRKDRDYQPVDLLAREISKELGMPYRTVLLVRTRQTEQQKAMKNLEQKRSNISGVFRINRPQEVRNQQVLLLDDLVNSGETLKEATRVLKQAGASKVYVLTLTKTMTGGI